MRFHMRADSAHDTSMLWRGFATIFALGGVLFVAFLVPLPGLDDRALVALPAGFWPWATGRAFSLGMTPFFAAALLGYVWIHVAPSWRRIGHQAITRFQRKLFFLALGWAGLFAYSILRSVHAITPLSPVTKIAWFVLLVGSVAFLGLVANWLTKRGIGQGAALFLASSFARDVQELRDAWMSKGLSEPGLEWVVTPALVAGLTVALWISRRENTSYVRSPTAGIVPIVVAFALPMLVTALALLGIVNARYAVAMTPGTWAFSVVAAMFTMVMTAGLSRVWNRSVATTEDVHARRAFRWALWTSMIFGLVFVLRPLLPLRNVIDPLMVVVVVAVGFDVGSEIVFRRKYGQLEVLRSECDVAAAKRAGLLLHQGGIPVLLRGEFFLTVTRVFGLLTPIEVMVPAHHAEGARKICAELTS